MSSEYSEYTPIVPTTILEGFDRSHYPKFDETKEESLEHFKLKNIGYIWSKTLVDDHLATTLKKKKGDMNKHDAFEMKNILLLFLDALGYLLSYKTDEVEMETKISE